MVKIFVSYSRKDTALLEKLHTLLELTYGDGNVWYDKNMRIGNWKEQLFTQIGSCDAVLYLLSEFSHASSNCKEELDEANRLSKPIIAIQIDKAFSIPDEWKDEQCHKLYDAENDISLEGLSRLNGAIIDLLDLKIPSEITRKNRLADMKNIRRFWDVVDGAFVQKFRYDIYNKTPIEFFTFNTTIREYVGLRQRPEYQFFDENLSKKYRELDDIISKVIMSFLANHDGNDTSHTYTRKKAIEEKSEKELLENLDTFMNQIFALGNFIRRNYPEFTFDSTEA